MIQYDAVGRVGRITLNRPEKRNAMTVEMLVALRHALQRAADDTTVRVLLITRLGYGLLFRARSERGAESCRRMCRPP